MHTAICGCMTENCARYCLGVWQAFVSAPYWTETGPVSQEELMDHVWDNSVDSFSNSIRVHISALRKKLRAALGYDPIRNRIGEGYLMGGTEA